MATVNFILLVGVIGTIGRKTAGEHIIVNFSMATNRRYKNRDGEVVDETHWHEVMPVGRAATFTDTYLSKGDTVCVRGELRYNVWEDRDGKKHKDATIYANDVQLLRRKQQDREVPAEAAAAAQALANDTEETPF